MKHTLRRGITEILDDALEGFDVDAVEPPPDDTPARDMLEIIISDLTSKATNTRGRSVRSKGGWRAPITYEGVMFYITVKEA